MERPFTVFPIYVAGVSSTTELSYDLEMYAKEAGADPRPLSTLYGVTYGKYYTVAGPWRNKYLHRPVYAHQKVCIRIGWA